MAQAHLKELDRVVLTTPIPAHGLSPGDIGTIVDVYGAGEGYEVEFCTVTGETIAVVTIEAGQVRAADPREIPSARRLAS